MSDFVEVMVDVEEEERFLRQYADMEFPSMGMTCNVVNCPDLVLFSSYAKYVDHFVYRHRSFSHIYACSKCKRRFKSKNNKRSHKMCQGVKPTFDLIKVVNKNYIPPGDSRMPRPPSVKIQNVESQPEFLAYKRRLLAEKRREYSQFTATRESQADILESFERNK